MNDILKQRLVGALILVALGVVFWPIIFVEPGDQEAAQQARIPPRPGVAVTPLEAPDLAGLRSSPENLEYAGAEAEDAPVAQAAETPAPAVDDSPSQGIDKPSPASVVAQQPAQRTREQPPEQLKLDSDCVPIAWILQVATVSSAEKAEQLRQRLLEVDQKAYVKKVKRGGKNLYRVYIGPKFERDKLEKMQANIDRQFGVK